MIFFYPHLYLRDRQLDTIRSWPRAEALNSEIANNRQGVQVSQSEATSRNFVRSWKQVFPLLNLKRRPKDAPPNATIYVWGGLILTGRFIVEIDNPWSLVGYNVPAMRIYRYFIKNILLSDRCLEIRCMSNACRLSLQHLLGREVFDKAKIHYPLAGIDVMPINGLKNPSQKVRLLFIGSQFEIKGGKALLDAYRMAKACNPNISLLIVTHLPIHFREIVNSIKDVELSPPTFTRSQVYDLMQNSDILVHPSYMESFGMTILEAMANGMAVIANDIYAISEMVADGMNGALLEAPITKWNGVLPNKNFMKKSEFIDNIAKLDITRYTVLLADEIIKLSQDPEKLKLMKEGSIRRFLEMRQQNA